MQLKSKSAATAPKNAAGDKLWSRYDWCQQQFRKACHSDGWHHDAVENKIRAKLVAAKWEAAGRPAIDVLRLSGAVEAITLCPDDHARIKSLFGARIARRDELCTLLGKEDGEGWDAFYVRNTARARVPFMAQCVESLT